MEHFVGQYDIGRKCFLVGKAFAESAESLEKFPTFFIGQSQWQFFGWNCSLAFTASCSLYSFLAADGDKQGACSAKQDICSALSNFQMVVFIVGYFEIAELQHLQQVVMPISGRYFTPGSKGLKAMVSPFCNFRTHVSSEDVH